MEELRRALALVNSQGVEFMAFVKDKDHVRNEPTGNHFFSESFVSSSIEKDPPLAFDLLVHRRRITVYETNIEPMIALPLDRPVLVHNYLCAAFKLLRQLPCKAIAKLWIKIIEPRKKTRFPYIKGDAKKPTWWPKDVEHREPDHLNKADRLNLMCTIIMDVLPQMPHSLEMVDELVRVTVAMPIFKRESVKKVIVKNIFEIAKCLCDKASKLESIALADLNDLALKQKKKSYHRHSSSVIKTANAEEELVQQSSTSDCSPLKELSIIENNTACLSKEHSIYPMDRNLQNSMSQLQPLADFGPLLLSKSNDFSGSDSLHSSNDLECFV
ncbi:hypothetical protein GRS66_005928 [Saccharomyces pastorianus]|uniref:Uncharacterized protein n=1 Tax=Saccharomyces pastorianus TaxID=27292 RepID=A0A6C1E3K2_SACPS|nr:hypothetical protein GRS66_005928 [Saccharomyces pastorianus]